MSDKKFQYSEFTGENKQGQIVVRADNIEDFKEALRELRQAILTKTVVPTPMIDDVPHPAETVQQKAIPVEQFEQTCEKCGAEKVLNPKTGKRFCKEKCWLKNQVKNQ